MCWHRSIGSFLNNYSSKWAILILIDSLNHALRKRVDGLLCKIRIDCIRGSCHYLSVDFHAFPTTWLLIRYRTTGTIFSPFFRSSLSATNDKKRIFAFMDGTILIPMCRKKDTLATFEKNTPKAIPLFTCNLRNFLGKWSDNCSFFRNFLLARLHSYILV